MKQTILHDTHVAHGAKLVDFAGWHMPIQYSGVLDEYHTVRGHTGLCDVSHMGRVRVEGAGALAFLQHLTTNDVAKIEIMGSQYSMVCNPTGGIKDDVFVYRLGDQEYLVCVNASNKEKIISWFQEHHTNQNGALEIKDCTEDMAQLALQGPQSTKLLGEGVQDNLKVLKPRRCLQTKVFDISLLITRTGYTGEVGYELYVPTNQVVKLWNGLMDKGEAYGLKPTGLGARDLLRLDMGYFLYGNDLTEDITPVEANATWIVGFDKGAFIGKEKLVEQRDQGTLRTCIAFELLEKAVPRQGMRMFSDGQEIGQITSGNLSPILQKGIGLGYVVPEFGAVGTKVSVDIRGRRVPAVVVKLPFYKRQKSA